MIKFLLSVIVVLALIGGAIQFKATDEDWSLVVNKEAALSSVKNGVITIYNFANEFITGSKETEKNEETLVTTPISKK